MMILKAADISKIEKVCRKTAYKLIAEILKSQGIIREKKFVTITEYASHRNIDPEWLQKRINNEKHP